MGIWVLQPALSQESWWTVEGQNPPFLPFPGRHSKDGVSGPGVNILKGRTSSFSARINFVEREVGVLTSDRKQQWSRPRPSFSIDTPSPRRTSLPQRPPGPETYDRDSGPVDTPEVVNG